MMTIKQLHNKYLFQFGYEKNIELNGKRHLKVIDIWSDEKPETLFIVGSESYIDYWTRTVGFNKPQEITNEDYQASKLMLESKGTYHTADDDDCDDPGWEFNEIADEVEYKRFLKEWVPTYGHREKLEPVEFTIVNIEGNTSNPFIVPFRYCGSSQDLKDNEVLYKYTAHPYNLLQLIGKKLGFEEVEDKTWNDSITVGMKYSIPSHSRNNLDFIKINGHYARESFQGSYYGISVGTWEECNKQYEAHRDKIQKAFEYEKKLIEAKGETLDKKDVVEKLEKIRSRVSGIESKRATYLNKGLAVNAVNDLIKEILG